MGIHTYTVCDITSPVTPSRLFQALVIDNHNFVKHVPQFVKSVEFVKGDSTVVGCIKQFNLPEGSPLKYVKNRVDELDFDKHFTKYSTIEGDILGDNLECIVYENSFDAKEGGCHFTMVAHYHTKGSAGMNEDHVALAKEAIKQNFKAVEEYLVANPQSLCLNYA